MFSSPIYNPHTMMREVGVEAEVVVLNTHIYRGGSSLGQGCCKGCVFQGFFIIVFTRDIIIIFTVGIYPTTSPINIVRFARKD
jgi:hypothetical protein